MIETCFVLPKYAHGQFLSIFDSIFSSIQNDIGSSLSQINQIMQQTQKLYQTTLAPLAALNQARGFVVNSINSFRGQMNQIFNTSFTSAVTPGPQQFESILHSRLSSEIPALQTSFISNYGTIPQVNAASPQDRVMMDVDDALGQENLKTTLIADQGADVILQTANQMENQVAVSTPGLQSLSYSAGPGRQSPLPGLHPEDACGGTAAGGRPHRPRQRAGQTQDRGDGRNQQPHHRSADGAIRSIRHDGSKEEPNKQRRSFFWRRKPLSSPDLRSSAIASEAPSVRAQPWYRPSLLKVAIVALAVLAILPTRANGQFGIDTAAILAALSKMQSLMNTFIATPLKTINQYEQSVAKYEQQVMYPLAAINQAKSSVMQFESQFNQRQQYVPCERLKRHAAAVAEPRISPVVAQRGECADLSGQFQNVYGVVMAQNAASPQMRTMTDMTDAQAQDAMKRAIEIDASSGRGVERGESDGPADLAGRSRQRSDP